jgi:hypothetical protein
LNNVSSSTELLHALFPPATIYIRNCTDKPVPS